MTIILRPQTDRISKSLFQVTIFIDLCSQLPSILEEFYKDHTVSPPCCLSSIELSPNLRLNIELDPYTDYEKNNATHSSSIPQKIVLKYTFPELKDQEIAVPPSIKRNKADFRDGLIANAYRYSYVKLDVDSLLNYFREIASYDYPNNRQNSYSF